MPEPLKHSSRACSMCSALFCVSFSGLFLLPVLTGYRCISFQLPNNESATYIMPGNSLLKSHCLHTPLSLVPFLFYYFSLIVCNSYQVSLRPTSVASNSAVGKPSVCCQPFIGFQGGGLLLFSVILARQ